MELKKTNKANLEKQRILFFEIGLLVALGIVFAAFEWGVANKNTIELAPGKTSQFETEQAPVLPPEPIKKEPARFIADQLVITELEVPEILDPLFIDPDDYVALPLINDNYQAPTDETNDQVAKEFEVEIQAQFMDGGNERFLQWVMEHIKYPELARINGIEGRVFASFVIDKKGNLTQIKIIRNIDQSLSEEATRVLSMSPTWKPAIKKGQVIAVQYQIPINFKLN